MPKQQPFIRQPIRAIDFPSASEGAQTSATVANGTPIALVWRTLVAIASSRPPYMLSPPSPIRKPFRGSRA